MARPPERPQAVLRRRAVLPFPSAVQRLSRAPFQLVRAERSE